MNAGFDPAADFAAAADGSEAVTLLRRGDAPGSPGSVVAHALRRAVGVREAAESNGHYTASDVVWHLPVEELGDPPHLGDVIADAAHQQWTVLEVQLVTLRTRWRCAARSLAIVYALDDTITILKAAYTKSSGGAAQAVWQTWKTGVRARIQPAAAAVGSQHRARQTARRAQIFVVENLALDHHCRIQGPDGSVYRVLGSTGAERIGELQTIEAELLPQ
jgi:hypothetical protein